MAAATTGVGPLDGLHTVDLSTTATGFQAGQVLADFGTEVVHVEPPGTSPPLDLRQGPDRRQGRLRMKMFT